MVRAEKFLLDTQRANGGWGESYLACVNKAYTAEGTGEVTAVCGVLCVPSSTLLPFYPFCLLPFFLFFSFSLFPFSLFPLFPISPFFLFMIGYWGLWQWCGADIMGPLRSAGM